MAPLHRIHLRLIPVWNPHNAPAPTGRDNWSRNRFSPPENQNLRSPISADWQLWFPLGWQSGGGRLDEEGRVWENAPRSSARAAKPTICRARCFRHDVTALTRNEGLGSRCEGSVQRYDLWPVTCRTAAESDGSAGEPDTSKPNLTVSQDWWLTITEKQMWNSRCCPRISRRNAHLMRNRARLQTECLFDRIKTALIKMMGSFFFFFQNTRESSPSTI